MLFTGTPAPAPAMKFTTFPAALPKMILPFAAAPVAAPGMN
jgi:hypothetical protein